MAPALQLSRKSFPTDGSQRPVSTAPPYADAPISALASRSFRPSKDISYNKDNDASTSQAISPTENKKAKFLKRNHSPTPLDSSSPVDLMSHSGESADGSLETVPSRTTRASVRKAADDIHDTFNSTAGDSQRELDDASSSTSKSQKSAGKKNQAAQRGQKRALDYPEEPSVEKSSDSKNKKTQNGKARKGKKNAEDSDSEEGGLVEGEDHWEVEAIVGARVANNAREYLVKWKGDEWDDTWEVEENVQHCQDLVREYEERQQQRKKKAEQEKAQKKAMKELQKKRQDEKYEQKKKEAEEQATKNRQKAEAENARKEEEEAEAREKRRKERDAKAKSKTVSDDDEPTQQAKSSQIRPPRNKPQLQTSAESQSSPKRKAGLPPSSAKRRERAASSESVFSPSKSPTPLRTPIITSAAKSMATDGSSPTSTISPKSIHFTATKRSAMDRNTQVVKILAHKPKELEIKRLEDVDFLINYAGSPNEFVPYETCLEKIPAHLCEYLAQNGPIFYPSRR
ncbi:hypothetical protein RvY_08106 [Ramazzottius varieornatus]|uniref:Chromo domain-containing protein n=1 Tax=Ramazzottius varieornatus TaxID=947166 RepID=A0A1D1VDW0_RAMVA|nr:hypothetical protein RvY_08106 [Ramazzottius varieornatus]